MPQIRKQSLKKAKTAEAVEVRLKYDFEELLETLGNFGPH